MRRYLLLLLLVFAAGPVSVSGQINYNLTDWIIKVNAVSPFDALTFPVPQVGVERRISRYWSVSAEGGYQIYGFKKPDTSLTATRGYKGNLELRYYIKRFYRTPWAAKLETVYLGFRPFFHHNRFSDELSFRTGEEGSPWHENYYTTRNNTYGLNVVMGFQKSVKPETVFDLYFGAGVMMRDITNDYLDYDPDQGEVLAGTEFMKFFKGLGLEKSSGIWPNLLVGFRIGLKL
jgi:hypothetical protein